MERDPCFFLFRRTEERKREGKSVPLNPRRCMNFRSLLRPEVPCHGFRNFHPCIHGFLKLNSSPPFGSSSYSLISRKTNSYLRLPFLRILIEHSIIVREERFRFSFHALLLAIVNLELLYASLDFHVRRRISTTPRTFLLSCIIITTSYANAETHNTLVLNRILFFALAPKSDALYIFLELSGLSSIYIFI